MENIILEFQEINDKENINNLINKKILFTYKCNEIGNIIGVGGKTKNIIESSYKKEDFYKENQNDLIVKFYNKLQDDNLMCSIKFNKENYKYIHIYTISQSYYQDYITFLD